MAWVVLFKFSVCPVFQYVCITHLYQIERSIGALPGRSVSDEAERSMISKLKSLLEPKGRIVFPKTAQWMVVIGAVGRWQMKGIWIYRDDEDKRW